MSSQTTVPLARPTLGAEEERAVCEVLRSGWVSQGPRSLDFEKALADYLGCRYVRVVNSGTSALMLALKAVGVGPGDSVVVPAFTCAASALGVLALGAKVEFADVEPASFHSTWEHIRPKVTPDTKAVILVHLFGRMAGAAGLAAGCRQQGLIFLEDAALALGATSGSQFAGTVGSAGCLSFHPRKMITTGEGGAVCTNDPQIAARVEVDRNYGAAAMAWTRFEKNVGQTEGFERVAFNAKLTDLQAAVGIVQLSRLAELIAERRRIAATYREALADVPALYVPPPPENAEEHVYQAFVCVWQPEPPDVLPDSDTALKRAVCSAQIFKSAVAARGVAISDAAQFLPGLPVFRREANEDVLREAYPVAYLAAKLAFALPIFPGMTSQEIDRVTSAVRQAAERASQCRGRPADK